MPFLFEFSYAIVNINKLIYIYIYIYTSLGEWIMWIMDIMDYIYSELQGTIVSHHRMLKLSSLVVYIV